MTLASQPFDVNTATLTTEESDVLRLLVATLFPYDDEDDDNEGRSSSIPSEDDKILLHACPAVLLAAKHLNDEAEQPIRHRAHLCMRRLSRVPKFAKALLNKGVMPYLMSSLSSSSGMFTRLYCHKPRIHRELIVPLFINPCRCPYQSEAALTDFI